MPAPMMMTMVMTNEDMIRAFKVAERPAEGNPRHQSMVSMTATMDEKMTVMTQARNPWENWASSGRVCVLRKEARAAIQKAAVLLQPAVTVNKIVSHVWKHCNI